MSFEPRRDHALRLFLVAGEHSGDALGAKLMDAIAAASPRPVRFSGVGGELMTKEGLVSLFPISDVAVMGPLAIIAALPRLINRVNRAAAAGVDMRPDAVVIIDSPEFTHPIARRIRKALPTVPILNYVSPSVWAWRPKRASRMRAYVDHILALLPFEPEVHVRLGGPPCSYVGHPLIEVVLHEKNIVPVEPLGDKPLIALLPGSRAQEIKVKLPIMLQMVRHFPEYRFSIAQAPSLPDSLYEDIIGDKDVLLVKGNTYNLLKQAKAGLITSGTATLETALFGLPQVVCYKGNAVSFWLATKLVNVKYISLVNLIMDKLVVTELIQNELTETNLQKALTRLLNDEQYKIELQTDYKILWDKLGRSNASDNAATEIVAVAAKK